jgi:hypothetical protein
MAPSTRGTVRFLLLFSIGFLVLGTLQGKVMAKQSAYVNNHQIFGVVICSGLEQLDRPYLRVVPSDASRFMKTLHNVSSRRKYVNIYLGKFSADFSNKVSAGCPQIAQLGCSQVLRTATIINRFKIHFLYPLALRSVAAIKKQFC